VAILSVRQVADCDFNADGQADILWQNTATGQRALWLMNGIGSGFTPASIVDLGHVDTNWVMAGTGDFNGDGQADILWQNETTGQRALWLMNGIGGGFTPASIVDLGHVDTNWQIAGTGDFNSDSKTDILWQNTMTGQRALWLMNGIAGGFTPASIVNLGYVDTNWVIAGTGDFDNDSQTDILWQNTVTGQRALWLMNGVGGGFTPASVVNLGYVDTNWVIAGTGDFNNNDQTDILWQNIATGQRALWLMNGIGGGFTPASIVNLGYVDSLWRISN
jgi:fructose-specific phosphotransferase system IIC component